MTATRVSGSEATRSWELAVPARDRARYGRAGIGGHAGVGQRPALLIIDVQYRTLGRERVPIDEAIVVYPTACGERGWAAVDRLAELLAVCRRNDVPVIHSYVSKKTRSRPGQQGVKVPVLLDVDEAGYAFATEVAPRAGELLVPKEHSSAFFGTSLMSSLVELGIDTLIVAGCTTSGCVRATVVDAASYNLRVAVVEECVYDRIDIVHDISLFDISMKYGDVVGLAQALEYVSRTAGTPR